VENFAAPGVPLGDAHHEAEVRLQQVRLGRPALADDRRKVGVELGVLDRRSAVGAPVQALLGEQAGLDRARQLDLLGGGQQLGATDPVQVRTHQIRRDPPLGRVVVQLGNLFGNRVISRSIEVQAAHRLCHLCSPPPSAGQVLNHCSVLCGDSLPAGR
jgi:hypothetical protein